MEPVVSAVVILGAAVVVLKKVVDMIQNAVPALSGALVPLVATVIGFVIAWFFDYQITELLIEEAGLPIGRDLPVLLDYVVAAVAMAGFAGYLHDQQKAAAAGSVVELEAPSPT